MRKHFVTLFGVAAERKDSTTEIMWSDWLYLSAVDLLILKMAFFVKPNIDRSSIWRKWDECGGMYRGLIPFAWASCWIYFVQLCKGSRGINSHNNDLANSNSGTMNLSNKDKQNQGRLGSESRMSELPECSLLSRKITKT
jgi:hypothetical protein